MIVVMIAKWVADSFNVGGIYSVWLAMRRYVWLPQTDFRDSGKTCEKYLQPLGKLAVIDGRESTVRSLGSWTYSKRDRQLTRSRDLCIKGPSTWISCHRRRDPPRIYPKTEAL